jgi:protein-tyrosine phosphatase
VTENDLNWADLVFVMETGHRSKLSDHFRHLELPPIDVLNIEDEYEFMDEELIDILRDRMNSTLKYVYKL